VREKGNGKGQIRDRDHVNGEFEDLCDLRKGWGMGSLWEEKFLGI
jgi:hypothetical protein